MSPQEALGIEQEVGRAFRKAAEYIGVDWANFHFDQAGLNRDRTWPGKDEQAWELTLHLADLAEGEPYVQSEERRGDG